MKKIAALISLCWVFTGFSTYAAPAVPFNPPKVIIGQPADTHADSASVTPAPESIAQKSPAYLKQMAQAGFEAKAAVNRCKDRYLLGEIKSHASLVHCINPAMITAYQRAGYPYMDLLGQINARRLAIARQIDSKNLTEAQGEAILTDFSKHMADEERKRNENPESATSESQAGN